MLHQDLDADDRFLRVGVQAGPDPDGARAEHHRAPGGVVRVARHLGHEPLEPHALAGALDFS